jgi:hypothetical protein
MGTTPEGAASMEVHEAVSLVKKASEAARVATVDPFRPACGGCGGVIERWPGAQITSPPSGRDLRLRLRVCDECFVRLVDWLLVEKAPL